MRALTFAGVERVQLVDKAEPRIASATDAVVRVDLAGLCGSDLHPYLGREPGLDLGTTMGHEAVGTVVEVGSDVQQLAVGDRVMSPFSTSCGVCPPCRRGLSSRCQVGGLLGWVEHGAGLEGMQAELVRVPLADGTLVRRPDDVTDAEALLLGDVVSTGFFAFDRGLAGLEPADASVAVVGLGAVGISAVLAANARGVGRLVALDPVPERRAIAANLGAEVLDPQARGAGDEARRLLADGLGEEGASVVVECVGNASSTALSVALARVGGHLSMASVHCEQHFELSPAAAYDKNLTLSIGRCPVRSRLDELMALHRRERLPLECLITHQVGLDDGPEAYRLFASRSSGCLKLVFEP